LCDVLRKNSERVFSSLSDLATATAIFEDSTLNDIMKEEDKYPFITHYSAGYWAIDVYEEYVRFHN